MPSGEQSGHETVNSPAFRDYYWFASVRHPFTRCISIWRRLVEHIDVPGRDPRWKPILQEARCFNDLIMSEVPYVVDYWNTITCSTFIDAAPMVHSIVRQEMLQEDFNQLPFINSRIKGTGKVNASNDNSDWQSMYTPESKSKVLQIFDQDFERYGYTRDFNAAAAGEVLL